MINRMDGNLGVDGSRKIAIPYKADTKSETSKPQKVQATPAVHVSQAAQTNISDILRANMIVDSTAELSRGYTVAANVEAKLNFRPQNGETATEAAVNFVENKVSRFHQAPPKAGLN